MCRRKLAVALVDSLHHSLRQRVERLAADGVLQRSGLALVAAVADACHKRYLCQQIHSKLFRKAFAASIAKVDTKNSASQILEIINKKA